MILAFLQNLWVKDPVRAKAWMDRNPNLREAFIRKLLFSGCLTGRRIEACFGDVLPRMIFEEATTGIAGDSRTVLDPEPGHIKSCLEKHRPEVVLTFGRVAAEAVRPIWIRWSIYEPAASFIACPHPAARQTDTLKKLKAVAHTLRKKAA